MSDDFSPSLARAVAQDGVKATRQAYGAGPAGVRQSLDVMAQKMREGKEDPAIKGWARQTLKDAGLDGRDKPSIREQASALLDALRAQTIYAPDSAGAEVISSAAATLCLRPNLCIRGGDCDDLSVALGSATLSLGIPTAIVKQSFGEANQEHVLVAVADENGTWLYADPSTRLPFGRAANASNELWIDPLAEIGNIPAANAEIITLGAPPAMQFAYGHWWHEKAGKVSVHQRGSWKETGLSGIPFDRRMRRTGVGAGVVLPGTVLAYRKLWDDYVIGTARAAAICADAWRAILNNQTPQTTPDTSQFAVPPDAKTLQLWADMQQGYSDSIIESWNMHSGLEDWEIVALASDILQDQQRVVGNVGNFYQKQIKQDCPNIALPEPPAFSVQKYVIGQIEGLDILAHGTMQIMSKGAAGGLQAYQTLSQKLTNPTTIEIGAVGVVIGAAAAIGGVILIDRLIPKAR